MLSNVGKALSVLESILFLGWIVLMSFGQAQATSEQRIMISFLSLHFLFTGLVLSAAMWLVQWKEWKMLHYGQLIFFLAAVAVDANNTTEVFQHLSRVNDMWTGIAVLACLLLAMSCLVCLWYVVVLMQYYPSIKIRVPQKKNKLAWETP